MSEAEVSRTEENTGTKPVDERLSFNHSRLIEWLHDNTSVELGKNPRVEQFKGGQSNPTYLVRGDTPVVIRRKPPGTLLPSAHAVDREYRVITALEGKIPVPKTYGLCTDDEVIGTWFYAMEALEGRVFWEPLIPALSQNSDRNEIYFDLNSTLAKLHLVNYEDVGLTDFGRPGNYVARQINRWSKQYVASETEEVKEMNFLMDWLPKHIPENETVSIVHGDYRLDNVMMHASENRVHGVLDWELSTLGDPLADFAYHLLYWFSNEELQDEANCRRHGIPTLEEYRRHYCEVTGWNVSQEIWDYYQVFSLFKIAAITQGIMGRVRDGTATSAQAKERAAMAPELARMAYGLWQEKLG